MAWKTTLELLLLASCVYYSPVLRATFGVLRSRFGLKSWFACFGFCHLSEDCQMDKGAASVIEERSILGSHNEKWKVTFRITAAQETSAFLTSDVQCHCYMFACHPVKSSTKRRVDSRPPLFTAGSCRAQVILCLGSLPR